MPKLAKDLAHPKQATAMMQFVSERGGLELLQMAYHSENEKKVKVV